jgi:peroxin-19
VFDFRWIIPTNADVLDKFNAPAATSLSSKPVTAPTTSSTASAPKKDEELDDEAFAQQFAAEMEAFMKSMVNPDGEKDEPLDPKVADQAEALRKAWEQLLVEDLEAMDPKNDDDDESTDSEPSASNARGKAKAKAKPETTSKAGLGSSSQANASQTEDEFQKAVRQAMEKLKESDTSNKVRRILDF